MKSLVLLASVISLSLGCSNGEFAGVDVDSDGTGDGTGDGDGDGVTCEPGQPVCVGDDLYVCNDDGSAGDYVMTCDFGCVGGGCLPDPNGGTGDGDGDGDGDNDNCSTDASEFVYVVDNANTLYRFDPANEAYTFTTIGTLSCPAGTPITGGGGPATPFSMSVDRDATAWVLYSSGEIFHVSTEDASCSATAFQKQQMGYDLMGMGFVSDSQGSKEEKLFVAGSLANAGGGFRDTKLGFIDPNTLQVTHIIDVDVVNPPELTGTGDARLYGYFPGNSSVVSELDKTTGTRVAGQEWPAGSITGNEQLAGWAFAQWGGKFYVFVTVRTGLFGGMIASRVVQVDPEANGGGGAAVVVKDSDVPYIVGAGVSTCAPVVVPQ